MSGRNRAAVLIVAVLTAVTGIFFVASASSARPYHRHDAVIRCTPFKVVVGHTVTCEGDDYLPNDHVVLTLHTAVYPLGSVNTDAQGHFEGKVVQLPAGVLGNHKIAGVGRGGAPFDDAFDNVLIVASGTGGQGTGGNGHGGGNSFTGVEVAGIGLLGVGLLVGGTLLVVSARRRRTAESD